MGYDEAALGSRQLTAPAGTLHPRAERLDDGQHGMTARDREYQSHLAQDAKTRSVALYGHRNMLEECRCNADAPRVGCSITVRWAGRAGGTGDMFIDLDSSGSVHGARDCDCPS